MLGRAVSAAVRGCGGREEASQGSRPVWAAFLSYKRLLGGRQGRAHEGRLTALTGGVGYAGDKAETGCDGLTGGSSAWGLAGCSE